MQLSWKKNFCRSVEFGAPNDLKISIVYPVFPVSWPLIFNIEFFPDKHFFFGLYNEAKSDWEADFVLEIFLAKVILQYLMINLKIWKLSVSLILTMGAGGGGYPRA